MKPLNALLLTTFFSKVIPRTVPTKKICKDLGILLEIV